MTIVQLSEVAKVDSGAGFPLEYQGCQGELFPFLKVSDMNLEGNERRIHSCNHSVSESIRSQLRAKAFPVGSLIFPKIGAAIGTNKKRQLIRPSCVDNNVMAVVPDTSKLNPDYLYFAFLAKNISDFASASNPPSIRKPDVENWKLPVPSLGEQVRVVEILTRAESIVRLRRQAQQKAAELVPSIFLDMFGDQATNPKGWPVVALGEVLSAADYGSSTKASDDGQGVPLIRMGNVGYDGSLDLTNLKFVQLGDAEVEKYVLRTGDILFNRTNSKDLVGKTGLWNSDLHAVVASYFIRLRVKADIMNSTFLWAFMNGRFMKKTLFNTARGAIGQANINSKELKAFRVMQPPLGLQKTFEQRVEAIQSIRNQQTSSIAIAEATFKALLSKSFST